MGKKRWAGLLLFMGGFFFLLLYGGMKEAAAQDIFIDLEAPEKKTGFSLEVVSAAAPNPRPCRVFIYHTHTYEAYENLSPYTYKPTEKWRTADAERNIVRVGAELARLLREAGIQVTHDTTAYEPPRLSTAYARSLAGIEKAAGEGYDLYIDMHRDSYCKNNGPNTVAYAGEEAARLLILIGKGTGTGFDERPDWQANEKVARCIAEGVNQKAASLCRGVSLKSGRYNQQAASPSLLIEVGNNRNTLPEALRAMEPLAHAICRYFDGLTR